MAKRSGLGRGVEAFYGGIGSGSSKKEEITAKIEPEEKKTTSKKADKAEKTVKPAKTVKPEKADKEDKTEKAEKTEKTEKAETAGKVEKTVKAKTTEKTEKAERTEQSDSTAKAGKSKTDSSTSEKKDTPKNPSTTKEAPVSHSLDLSESDVVTLVKVAKIEPNRDQPRKDFDEEGLQELAESLSNLGVIQPILVRPKGDFFEIVAGERRWRAARMAGMKEVPVIIRKDYTDADVAEIALVENLQRQDLNKIEEAMAYQKLIDEYNLTQEEVAFRVSKKRTSITNSLRLLKLHPSVQEMIQDGTISMGHAKVLLGLDTPEQQLMVALMIAQEDLSVRLTEQRVHEIMNPKQEKPKKSLPDQLIYQDLEQRLGSSVNSKVVIHRTNAKKGKIEIAYTSLEELERIAELLGVKL